MELGEIIRATYPVSDEWIDRLSSRVHSLHVKRGGLLITQGKRNENLYFIRDGLVRSFCVYDGKEDTRWFALAGDVIASMFSLYKGQPAMSSVEALMPTDLYYISISEMEMILSESFELSSWAYKLAMEQLYALERQYTYVGIGDAYARYKSFLDMRAEIIQQIPLKHIASYLKITPQTLSKIRLKYARGR